MQRYTIKKRENILRDYKASGLSQYEYAKQNNISKATLSYWYRKYTISDEDKTEFVKIEPVSQVASYSGITIRFNSIFSITLQRDFDIITLQKLLSVLGTKI